MARWNPAQPIPVFFAPIDDESATVIEGIDTNLQSISVPAGGDTAPYTCLVLNFDEDSPVLHERSSASSGFSVPQRKSLWTWRNIWNVFSVSPAHAHYPIFPFDDDPGVPHDPCYSNKILQPVKKIAIYDDHEDWPMGAPEIFMGIKWPNEPVQPYRTSEEDLEELDETNRWYETEFEDLRTLHGTCGGNGKLSQVYVEEMDPWGGDDLGRWYNVGIPTSGFAPNQVDLTTSDVFLRMRRTNENAWKLPNE